MGDGIKKLLDRIGGDKPLTTVETAVTFDTKNIIRVIAITVIAILLVYMAIRLTKK